MTLIAEELSMMSSRELISPGIEIRTEQRPNDKIDQFEKSKDQVQREESTPQNVRFDHQKVQFDGPEASFDRTHIQRTEPSEKIVNPFWFVNFKNVIIWEG
jgi:hypothetical protein